MTVNETQRGVIEGLHNSPFRAKAEWDDFLPHNFTVAWALGTKSFCEILARQVMEDGRVAFNHQKLWYEAEDTSKQLPDIVYGFAFLTALKYATEHEDMLVHYIRQDNERVVPENANNAPFRSTPQGWRKFKK